ncbi:topoisomerase II-associated protein PAT1 [Syncephalis plumigaleata]|nr:topoisomerase II-associated protein PAT1 [Syncephalis plumigaleata]
MSFFGFDTALPTSLKEERRRPGQPGKLGEHQSLQSDYVSSGIDGDLGGELIESLDELNDETFGGVSGDGNDATAGAVDNNFDYASSTMRAAELLEKEQRMHGFQPQHDIGVDKRSSNQHGSYREPSNGSRFDLDDMLARDTATLTLDYQDLMPSSSSKRPAYAALWDDAPRNQSPGPSVPISPRSSAVNNAAMLESNARVGNIWSTGSDGGGQRQGDVPNPQLTTWGTPTMPAGVPPMEQQSYNAAGLPMNQVPQPHMHMHQTTAPSVPRVASQTKPLSLQDIEAELLRNAQTGNSMAMNQMHATNVNMLFNMPSLMPQPHASGTRNTLSVAELEAAMKQSITQTAAMQGGVFGATAANAASMPTDAPVSNADQMRIEQRNAIREAKLAAMAKYNDPSADDFYCRMYTAVRGRAAATAPEIASRDRGTGRNRRETGIQRMQQQIQRIVNDAKKRPKATQVSLEGALGKIAVTSVRNPKQSLQIETPAKSTDAKPSDSPTQSRASGIMNSPALHKNDRRKVMQMVEAVYEQVLALEELVRQQAKLPQNASDDEESSEIIEKWHQEYSTHTAKLWSELYVSEPLGTSFPHPFIGLLSLGKGKKVLPRVLRHCTPDQTLSILTVLFACMDQVDAVRLGVQATHGVATLSSHALEQIDLFHNHSIPPLLVFLSDTPMRVIIALLSLLIERVNIAWVARSKTGLAFLTMFLSRAEIICQNASTMPNFVTPDEIRQWKELYLRLFSLLQGSFASLFPVNDLDDGHVWQFLAAIAVGANIDQQHILVTEVRERVLENVSAAMSGQLPADQATLRIANVNLFLHALGLDASQVAPMQHHLLNDSYS